jgi:hypothetical protein
MKKVEGISGKMYYIGNPVLVRVLDTEREILNIEMVFENLDTGHSTSVFRLFPNADNVVTVDVSPVVKSLMGRPVIEMGIPNSVAKIRVGIHYTYSDLDTDEYWFEKTFLRAWKHTNETNITPTLNSVILPTNKIPTWGDVMLLQAYYLTADGISLIEMPENKTKMLPVKKCDYIVVRFLNSLGGISYWRFDSNEINHKNNEQGKISNSFDSFDLGSETDIVLILRTKIEKEFITLMRDLIYSPLIHYSKNGIINYYTQSGRPNEDAQWIQIKSIGNKIDENFDSVAKLELKFEDFSKQKPTVLW